MNFKSTAAWQFFKHQAAIRNASRWWANARLRTLILFLCLGHACGYWAEPMRATPRPTIMVLEASVASTFTPLMATHPA